MSGTVTLRMGRGELPPPWGPYMFLRVAAAFVRSTPASRVRPDPRDSKIEGVPGRRRGGVLSDDPARPLSLLLLSLDGRAPVRVGERGQHVVLPGAADVEVVAGVALDHEAHAAEQAAAALVDRDVIGHDPVQASVPKT